MNLKSDLGRTQFRALAATADVIVENFRPGVMDRLGLAYEMLAADNPRLVYAAIRGYGDPRSGKSPYADWPSYDVVAQAIGGLMSITGADANSPTKTGPGVGDIFAGMMMAFGIMAALREAEATGKGQFVDVAMYDAMISLCERMVYQHDITKQVPGPEGNGHPFLSPFWALSCLRRLHCAWYCRRCFLAKARKTDGSSRTCCGPPLCDKGKSCYKCYRCR